MSKENSIGIRKFYTNPKKFSNVYFYTFCKIDDFFSIKTFLKSRSFQDDKTIESSGCPRSLHSSKVMNIPLPTIKVGKGTENTDAVEKLPK